MPRPRASSIGSAPVGNVEHQRRSSRETKPSEKGKALTIIKFKETFSKSASKWIREAPKFEALINDSVDPMELRQARARLIGR